MITVTVVTILLSLGIKLIIVQNILFNQLLLKLEI